MRTLTYFYALLTIVATTAYSNQLFCLEAKHQEKNIIMELKLPEQKKIGAVKYQHGHGSIPIIWAKSKSIDDDSDRPKEFISTWTEKIGKERTGTYIISTQGG